MTPTTLLYFTGITLVLALLFFGVSWRLFRRSRNDVFWRRRREAGQRGWRLFVLACVLVGLSGLTCVGTVISALFSTEDSKESSPAVSPATGVAVNPTGNTPTITPMLFSMYTPETITALSSPMFTSIPLRSDEPSPTPAGIIITATPGGLPTETPYPPYTPNVPPLESSVTPRANAKLTITALDDQVSEDGDPVQSHTTFQTGTTRIYFFVRFSGMTPGVLWKRYLYHDGQQIAGDAYLWESQTAGTTYFFFGNESGFEPGYYEIHLLIGESDDPVNIASFTVE
jgi:hypothetical protein